MKNILLDKNFFNELTSYCERRGYTTFSYDDYVAALTKLTSAQIDDNILERNDHLTLSEYDKYVQIIRYTTEFLYKMIFEVAKIEEDVNTVDTPKRLAKMLVPPIYSTNELFSGRWCVKPTLTTFCFEDADEDANFTKHSAISNNIIKVKVNIYSVCSHHFLPFGTMNNSDSSAEICYIPNKIYPGLSKIGRFVNYISRRGWLQEKLTETIANSLYDEFELKGVYVYLNNLAHTCSIHRGYADDTLMATEYYNGIFREKDELLKIARDMCLRK